MIKESSNVFFVNEKIFSFSFSFFFFFLPAAFSRTFLKEFQGWRSEYIILRKLLGCWVHYTYRVYSKTFLVGRRKRERKERKKKWEIKKGKSSYFLTSRYYEIFHRRKFHVSCNLTYIRSIHRSIQFINLITRYNCITFCSMKRFHNK